MTASNFDVTAASRGPYPIRRSPVRVALETRVSPLSAIATDSAIKVISQGENDERWMPQSKASLWLCPSYVLGLEAPCLHSVTIEANS
ncbi:hypothetical protein BaRGS_00017463 [Batillaria attramentaria]|uniref:Uncharacterized protein n=1 Tax=Batillaria attramentaria TaxID=370345 RepID=A0ABD0KW73_9CAEN